MAGNRETERGTIALRNRRNRRTDDVSGEKNLVEYVAEVHDIPGV